MPTNAFNGSVISEAKLQAEYRNCILQTVMQHEQVLGLLAWADGHYQTLQAGGDINCLLLQTGQQSGVLGRMRLQLAGDWLRIVFT